MLKWPLFAGLWLCACTYNLPPLSRDTGRLPSTLSRTGLYADASLTLVADGVRAYAPSHELWSDGAVKRRWIRLPRGARIDTSNMDDWVLPVGTQLWKEFTRGGKRIETRLIQRVRTAPDGWAAAAYVWDADQREARLRSDGLADALETSHDVPEARACPACHAGRASFALGFSALQLTHDAATADELTLARLVAEQRLSTTPAAAPQIPGDSATRAALGYLHANCGNCHNSARPASARYVRPPTALDFWLVTRALSSPQATPTYKSTLTRFVVPGNPADSSLWRRMQGRGFLGMRRRMPPLASELVDKRGSDVVARWITQLTPLPVVAQP
jgi:hypothetical protein